MVATLRALLLIDPAIVVLTMVMGTLSLGASLFDSTGRLQHRIARAWARMLMAVSGVRVVVEGLEKLDPKSCYVLAANHMSYMDIPAVLGFLPLEIRFFAKKGLFSIPFLGTHLRRAGHLPVIRGDARASLKTLQEAGHLIRKRRITPLLFPEGGRSPVELRPFKEGAAHLAIKAGVPAVPVGLSGTRAVLPMSSVVVRPGLVRVRIGDPIPTAEMKSHDRGELNRLLREKVAELMR
jgi:1-acyl-sn-glycerol-3-phosphate acyltransferase